jgi:hypothetical protein
MKVKNTILNYYISKGIGEAFANYLLICNVSEEEKFQKIIYKQLRPKYIIPIGYP